MLSKRPATLQVIRMVGESQETVSVGGGSGSSSNKMPTLEEYGTNLTTQATEVSPSADCFLSVHHLQQCSPPTRQRQLRTLFQHLSQPCQKSARHECSPALPPPCRFLLLQRRQAASTHGRRRS